MKSLRESIENSVTESNKTVEFDRNKYDYSYDSLDFEDIQPYFEEVYNAYVKEYGDKVPDQKDMKGRKWKGYELKGKFESNFDNIFDTNRLSVHSAVTCKYYVYDRLAGMNPDEAIKDAVGQYEGKFGRR